MTNDASVGILVVGIDGTTVETGRIDAVMTCSCDGLLKSFPRATHKRADVPPCFLFVQSVEVMAGRDAGFAAGALIEFDFKPVLLPRLWSSQGDEITVLIGPWDERMSIVPPRELLDCGERLLLRQEHVNQQSIFGHRHDWLSDWTPSFWRALKGCLNKVSGVRVDRPLNRW